MKYRDEEDKCYGVTGMAIGLTIFEADDLFNSITIDADGLDCISFTPAYYFMGNPAISARNAWKSVLQHYQLTSGLVIADAMCRRMFRDRGSVDKALRKSLYDAICEEGKTSCQLEEDEVDQIFEKSYRYLMKLLSNYQVQDIVRDFAHQLKTRRVLTQHEVAEELHMLR